MRPRSLKLSLNPLRLIAVAASLALVFVPGAWGVAASASWNGEPRPLQHLPVVRQSQRASCGPAALATLSNWLGQPRTEAELIAEADMGPTGVTLGEFARLAAHTGLPGSWYRVGAAQLHLVPAPFVAHLDDGAAGGELGHLVVVAGVGHGYVVVADPAEGAYVGPVRAFARRFTGRVFVLDEQP